MRNAYKIVVGKPKWKSHLEDRHRWEDNINMNHNEIGWEGWTGFIWLRTKTHDEVL
jgi:hypothetical protein